MKKMLMVLGVLGLLVGGSSPIAGDTQPQPESSPNVECHIRVPAGTVLCDSIPTVTLAISPETATAVVYIATAASPTNTWPTPQAAIVNLKTGEITRIADLLGKGKERGTATCQLSNSRSHLLVSWTAGRDTTVYAIRLPDGAPVKIAQGRVKALWASDGVVVSTVTNSKTLSRVSFVEPSTGHSKQLPVCGMVVAGLPDGTFLMGGDPEALETEVSLSKAMEQARLLHIDAAGKVVADIAPIGIVSSPPVASSDGKFIAFQSKPADAPEGPNTRYGFTVMSVDGTFKQQHSGPSFPVAVMNDGSAVVMMCSFDQHNSSPLCWLSSDGQKVKKLGVAVSAAVIDDSVIYASNRDKPAIKTISLAKE